MSPLQISLLVLGAVVIVGVLAFNWLQERSHRRRAEQAFDTPPRDVLFDVDPRASLGQSNEEPAPAPLVLGGVDTAEEPVQPAPVRPLPEPTRAEPSPEAADDVVVDAEAQFEASEAWDADRVGNVRDAFASLGRAVRLEGIDERTGLWLALEEGAGSRGRRLRAAMPLADRQSMATRAEIEAFAQCAGAVADRLGASVRIPDIDALTARAKALDAFCAEVDIAIGLSVVARTGQVFQGTTIRALAEAAGLRLKPDGQFHYEDAHGQAQFTLDNQDSEPFFPESMKSLTTTGITFLLDVPRASGGVTTFDRLVQITRKFASTLDGIIVDDNRQPLNDNGLDAIRRHLTGVYAAMEQAGIPAGNPVATRLFA